MIDHLRAVQGTRVAALVRELLGEDRGGLRKVSLRATDSSLDVSRIARKYGGGGHTQAAGFTTDIPYPELVEGLREQVREQLPGTAEPGVDGVLLYAKPAGVTSHDVVARVRHGLERGTKVGHAGTLDPFATGLLLVLVGPRHAGAALPHGPAEDLPRHGTPRLALRHGRPRRRARGDRARAGAARAADRRADAAPAGVLGRPGGRRAGLPAGPARRGAGARAARP